MLLLEMFQAGLSWRTIIIKRENFRQAFANFDYRKVALFDEKKIEQLMQDEGIIRNRQKITAAVNNAQSFMQIQEKYGSFDQYIWHFSDGKVIDHKIKKATDAPSQDELSRTVASDLKKERFNFVGPVEIYSFLQAIGVINDHEVSCAFYHPNATNYN